MAKYITYFPGEILQQSTYDSLLWRVPRPGSSFVVVQDGNPRTTAYTKAWVCLQEVNRHGVPIGNERWTFKRFYRRDRPVIAYRADQEADASEELL